MITFFVPIVPKPSNKRKAAIVGGHARVVQGKGVKQHQSDIAAIAAQYAPEVPFAGPVSVSIMCIMPRPKSAPKRQPNRAWHAKRPDADNLAKSVLDALSAWWVDDCQVAELQVRKIVASIHETAGYRVVVDELPEVY